MLSAGGLEEKTPPIKNDGGKITHYPTSKKTYPPLETKQDKPEIDFSELDSKEIYDSIVSPICSDLSYYSLYSSHSSQNREEVEKSSDEGMTNGDKEQKTLVTKVTQNDANDEYSEQGSIENPEQNKNQINFSELDKEFENG